MDPLDFKFVDNLRPPCSMCGKPLILTKVETDLILPEPSHAWQRGP
jgi:hypothetical protein